LAAHQHPAYSSNGRPKKHSKDSSHLRAENRTKSQLKLEGYEEAEDGTLEPEDEGLRSDGERVEDGGESSLTRQLAQTAVGVREMSKALGESHASIPRRKTRGKEKSELKLT